MPFMLYSSKCMTLKVSVFIGLSEVSVLIGLTKVRNTFVDCIMINQED